MRFVATRAQARSLLGASLDAVVLDLHDTIDADVIGMCHGVVRGGGALILRLGEGGGRFYQRLVDRFEGLSRPASPLSPAPPVPGGTAEQAALVDALRAWFAGPPALGLLTADRGRGKSAALGLALPEDAVVCAGSAAACAEVLRFAPHAAWTPPMALLRADAPRPSVLVVDEAAQIPLPVLQRLVDAHPQARIAFATTTRGYEGTGRGFVLRFEGWLAEQPRPLRRFALAQPIRWDADDPLEALIFDLLLLDARPGPARPGSPRCLDRSQLDEATLRAVFGLLVGAHYRTTPSDLQRLLDAPNLATWVHGDVQAASLVATEGGLDEATCRAMAAGERIRGHALADTLVSHLGRLDAGAMRMARSVRIVTHPEQRRNGVASELVRAIEGAMDVDLFGTLFGATPGLLRFRRSLGYQLVRVGASRGSRSGEPAAVMVHPRTTAAVAMVAELRADLARDLPLQLELLERDGGLLLSGALREALMAGLPAPAPMTDAARDHIVAGYLSGARHYEAAATAIEALVDGRRLAPVVVARVLERRGWPEVADECGFASVPAAMRALRRVILADASAASER